MKRNLRNFLYQQKSDIMLIDLNLMFTGLLNDLHRFDPLTLTWSDISKNYGQDSDPPPQPRFPSASCAERIVEMDLVEALESEAGWKIITDLSKDPDAVADAFFI